MSILELGPVFIACCCGGAVLLGFLAIWWVFIRRRHR